MSEPHPAMGEMPDVFGTIARDVVRTDVRLKVKGLCGWQRDTFPGSQPVSLSRTHLRHVRKESYTVCEKTDGTRYLLYIHGGATFFVDRKNEVRQLPPMKFFTSSGKPHMGTLVDGELVLDIVADKETGAKTRRHSFLIYDLVAFNGIEFRESSLTKRMRIAMAEIVLPRVAHQMATAGAGKHHQGVVGLLPHEPFSINLKPMYAASHAMHVWRDVVPHLDHASDGLILTPVNVSYVPGTCDKLLKWKPDNTVDFMMRVHLKAGKPGYYLHGFQDGVPVPFDYYTHTPEEDEEWGGGRHINGKIVECTYDPNKTTVIPDSNAPTWDSGMVSTRRGGWQVLRIRDDKDSGNDVRVIKRIMKAKEDAVGIDELVEACMVSPPVVKESLLHKDDPNPSARAPPAQESGGGGDVGQDEKVAGDGAPPAKRQRHD